MKKDKKDVVDDSVIEDYSDYEDNLREEKLKEEKIKEKEESFKDARTISVIVTFIIILFGVGIYGFAYLSKEDNNFNKNNNLNSDYISDNDIPTFSDEEEINEEDFDGKVVNIYQKGYADNGPIAFTYKCRSDQCDVKVIDNGFILYDEEKVYYREMTSYEYEQINNSEKSPMGSRLERKDFDIVDCLKNQEHSSNVYVINNDIYIAGVSENDLILSYDEYRNKGYKEVARIDNLVLTCGFIYDYISDKILYYYGETNFEISKYGKFGNVYYFDMYISACPCDRTLIYDLENYKVNFIENEKKDIVNDKLYYIDKNENDETKDVVYSIKSNGEVSVVSEEGIKPSYIVDGKLIYLDSNNIIGVKNLKDNNNYSSEIEVKNKFYLFSKDEDGFEILEDNHTILKHEEFNEYRKTLNVSDKDFKMCLLDLGECPEHGYLINFDKDGKFISREYYYEVKNDLE